MQRPALKLKREAEAAAAAAKGKAEAEAIEAKGKAEAEAARLLSDAQAANDRVNFEIQKLEIEKNAEIQVSTAVATVMAKLGENARFYDFSGGTSGEGDLLTKVLGNIPQMFAKTNLQNQALNDEAVTDTIRKLIGAIAGPIRDGDDALPDAGATETE